MCESDLGEYVTISLPSSSLSSPPSRSMRELRTVAEDEEGKQNRHWWVSETGPAPCSPPPASGWAQKLGVQNLPYHVTTDMLWGEFFCTFQLNCRFFEGSEPTWYLTHNFVQNKPSIAFNWIDASKCCQLSLAHNSGRFFWTLNTLSV